MRAKRAENLRSASDKVQKIMHVKMNCHVKVIYLKETRPKPP